MNSEHKKYILENMGKKSPARIASELGIRERKVKRVIEEQRDKGVTRRAIQQETQPTGAALPIKKTFVLASIALIIILGFAVYANSLNGKFVYDDDTLIANNSFVKNWSLLPKVFSEDIGTGADKKYSFYRPILMITYALDYRLWKLNVVGYHLTNIILHILIALCIYWLVSILFGDGVISLFTAAFFAVHPIHTTVVSYISTRAEELCLLFLLISFIFYIKSICRRDISFFFIIILSYFLALLSKENALILPALILLYHYTFKEKIRLREFLPVAGLAFVYILIRMTVLKFLLSSKIFDTTFLQRIPGFFAATASYVRLLFLPVDLHIEYGRPLFNLADPKAVIGLAILVTLIFCVFRTLKTSKLVFFSISWFLITLFPVSNLYPLNAYMSESWLYLPSVGFFMLLAGFLKALYEKEKVRMLTMVFTVCLLAIYSYLTIMQNRTWADPVLFYERTLKYSPDNLKISTNLGIIYYKMGDKEKAVSLFKKALEIDPYNAVSYNNLGVIYATMGENNDAVAMFKKAVELNPSYADAYSNLANTYKESSVEDAIAMYRKVIELTPSNANVYNNLGMVYFKTGRHEDAIGAFKKALEVNPDYTEARRNLEIVKKEMEARDIPDEPRT